MLEVKDYFEALDGALVFSPIMLTQNCKALCRTVLVMLLALNLLHYDCAKFV